MYRAKSDPDRLIWTRGALQIFAKNNNTTDVTDGGSRMTDIDINKAIGVAQAGADLDQMAREDEIRGWSRDEAIRTAQAEGVELGDAHWKVIDFLREIYVQRGVAPHARMLSNMLNGEFSAAGGSRFLYQLFPGGPVAQGSRIAGVPAPHDAQDLSFGSSF